MVGRGSVGLLENNGYGIAKHWRVGNQGGEVGQWARAARAPKIRLTSACGLELAQFLAHIWPGLEAHRLAPPIDRPYCAP